MSLCHPTNQWCHRKTSRTWHSRALSWHRHERGCIQPPAHESVSPTCLLLKCSLISSPQMNCGQYHLFLMSALAKTPFFLNPTIPFNTQNPLSSIMMNPLKKIGVRIRSNHPTVEPRLSYYGWPSCYGWSFPSTISIPHMIPLAQQHTE